MKTRITLIATIFLILSVVSNAQTFGLSDKMYSKVEKNIIYSLNHEVPSIAESTIFNLIVLKNRFPEGDFSEFIEELEEISFTSNKETTRYKAQLAIWYIDNADEIGQITIDEKGNQNKYFNEIADRIQKNLIAINN